MTDPTAPVITIDGPSGSGKGTIAQRLAQKLGWHLLDSGALYRLLAVAAAKTQTPLESGQDLAELAQQLNVEFKSSGSDGVTTLLDGENVSLELRTEETGRAASQLAALPAVREALLARQHAFLQAPGLVADGRDMGTVVFPAAALKIFLTASAEARAQRRHKQLNQKGISANVAGLLEEIRARDQRDQNRSVSPLKPASDAVILDTTEMSISDVCAEVYARAKAAGVI